MPRPTSIHVCSACGHETPRWAGQCPGCGEWNTLVEEVRSRAVRARPWRGVEQSRGRGRWRCARSPRPSTTRLRTGIGELDNVLGGGIVPGSLVLIGGSPGIGKSTLTTMVLANLHGAGRRTLYVSAEESAAQIRLRAQRLRAEALDIPVIAETDLDTVLATLEAERPEVCVIDSVQTLHCAELSSAAGSVGQVREVAGEIMRVAKALRIAVLLVGHVTKDGALAGPRVLEHLVDCVLQFEGERERTYRTVRAIKNRFGSTNEAGVFEMRDDGLVEVLDASARFVGEATRAPGSVVLCAMEGSRPLLVEVQALVSQFRARAAAAGGLGDSIATASRSCSPCSDATPGSGSGPATCSSTSSAACASTSPAPISRWRWRSPAPQGHRAQRRRWAAARVLRRARADRRAADGRPRRPPAGRGGQVRPSPGARAGRSPHAAGGARGALGGQPRGAVAA